MQIASGERFEEIASVTPDYRHGRPELKWGAALEAVASKIAQRIPVVGEVLATYEALEAKLSQERLEAIFADIRGRLDKMEKETGRGFVMDETSQHFLAAGLEKGKADPLAHLKAGYYGSAVVRYMTGQNSSFSEAIEVLDSLRQLTVNDLELLKEFLVNKELVAGRPVLDLIGYHPLVDPFEGRRVTRAKMEAKYPTLVRLQGFGLLFLELNDSQGGLSLDIGGLSGELRKWAMLTPTGSKLVSAIFK